MNVLLIDANPLALSALSDLVEGWHPKARTAAADSIRALVINHRGKPYDLVISTLTMPSVHPDELVTYLEQCFPTAKFAFLPRGEEQSGVVARVLAAGHLFLPASCTAQEITKQLKDHLAARAKHTQIARNHSFSN